MSARAFNRIGIVGGGAWGTALAQALAASGHAPLLWAYEADTVADINQRRRNEAYLSGIPLSARIGATCDLSDIALCDLILMVPPAQQLRRLSIDLAGDAQLKSDVPLVVCSKGIETSTNALLGRVMSEAAPSNPHAFLSGPSFAADVGRGRPAALTVACADEAIGEAIALTVGSEQLRLYWSDDAIGVQLGGAVKNVLAIAAGIVDGLKLGPSAHAALVTRGFAEMRRFGRALGADEKTLSGLAGLGDLLLTCGSPQSRNMSLGRAIGAGQRAADVLAERKAVTEGVYTARAMVALANEYGIDAPIARTVQDIVDNGLEIDDAIAALMSRPFKLED